MTPYIGRFAPSPTGPLHVGSLLAALASYLDAKAHGGTWLVRMEDVDETRCRREFAHDILRTLDTFALHADGEVMVQSSRKARYAEALGILQGAGHVYACTCSRKEIADSGILGIDGRVYPGTCRSQNRHETPHAIRVLTDGVPIAFIDRLQGTCTQRLETEIGDFVLKRRDGLFAYQLAVVVDDADQHVTDVVRGADLIDSTARQIHLQHLLGWPAPRYLHIPVATNELGQKLSKQTLAPGIGDADRAALTRQALAFLGQTTPPDGLAQPALLDFAIRHWQAATIPARRAIPWLRDET
jgi:glutamyl-Q tRNA(Asp) synthetase